MQTCLLRRMIVSFFHWASCFSSYTLFSVSVLLFFLPTLWTETSRNGCIQNDDDNRKCQSAYILSVKKLIVNVSTLSLLSFWTCGLLHLPLQYQWAIISFLGKIQIKMKNVILGTQSLEFHSGYYQLYVLRPTIQYPEPSWLGLISSNSGKLKQGNRGKVLTVWVLQKQALPNNFCSYNHNSFYYNFILSLCFAVITTWIWIFYQFLQFNW